MKERDKFLENSAHAASSLACEVPLNRVIDPAAASSLACEVPLNRVIDPAIALPSLFAPLAEVLEGG